MLNVSQLHSMSSKSSATFATHCWTVTWRWPPWQPKYRKLQEEDDGESLFPAQLLLGHDIWIPWMISITIGISWEYHGNSQFKSIRQHIIKILSSNSNGILLDIPNDNHQSIVHYIHWSTGALDHPACSILVKVPCSGVEERSLRQGSDSSEMLR